LLALINGAYGERIARMAAALKIDCQPLTFAEDQPVDHRQVLDALARDASITHVALVHCETTTGMLNPLQEVGQAVRQAGRVFIVDAMSSFGGVPIDIQGVGIDFLVSSANKCIEGVPGFSFVIGRRDLLLASEGCARSLSLDLLGQWKEFERSGQFRFTPPTHCVLAFVQALRELEMEGGIGARGERYIANHDTLLRGMRALGFHSFLPPEVQSYIITAFAYPSHPGFDFKDFYRRLSDLGMLIYPGKLTQVPTFRIGTIGRLFPADIEHLVEAIRRVLADMGITLAQA